MLNEIVYISHAKKPFAAEELLALLQQCRANNPLLGVTGMLLYGNETFLQALEGDAATLDALVEKIARDPRHTEIQVLRRQTINRRRYPDWSMGFKRVAADDLLHIDGLRNFGEQDFTVQTLRQHGDVVESLMDFFRLPYSEAVTQEFDERDRIIEHLEQSQAEMMEKVEIACLVFESVIDASRIDTLNEGHIALCRTALAALKQEPR